MTRYERVLEIAKRIEAAVGPKTKSRNDVERFLADLRASKDLPQHCEWAERAADDWNVTGKAAKLFQELEDIVNFRPTLVRAGVYDEAHEQDDYTKQTFETRFDGGAVAYIQWQIDLEHEEEFYNDLTIDFGWKIVKDGTPIADGFWDSKIESSWIDSSSSFCWGEDEPGEWKAGAYVVHVSLWDEPLAAIEFTVTEGTPVSASPKPTPGKRNRFERVSDLASQIEAVLPKSLKSREVVVAQLADIRSKCAARNLPKTCEWGEEAAENLGVKGAAKNLFYQLEDLVNFHPKLLRIGFFDGTEEPKFERKFTKRFEQDKIKRITFQMDIDHEAEQYGTVSIEWRCIWTRPSGGEEGLTGDEVIVESHVEETWGNSFQYETFGAEDVCIWVPGRYTLAVSLWDEPFAEASLVIDAPEVGGL